MNDPGAAAVVAELEARAAARWLELRTAAFGMRHGQPMIARRRAVEAFPTALLAFERARTATVAASLSRPASVARWELGGGVIRAYVNEVRLGAIGVQAHSATDAAGALMGIVALRDQVDTAIQNFTR